MNEAETDVPASESTESEHVGDYLRRLVDGHDKPAITLHTADVKALLDCWHNQAVTIELYQSEKGYDVLQHLGPRIDKLYMALNARARGDENDLDGEPAEPWNRLVGALATALVVAMGNGRWAVLEHKRADALIETSTVVAKRLACQHEFDPECGRCEWMAPFRRALADATRDAKAETKIERAAMSTDGDGRS